jgi:hypothetical protein
MKSAQTNLSKLKACYKSAQGKAAGRHPGLAAGGVTTLKGLQNFCTRICVAPFQGAEFILDFSPGYRSRLRFTTARQVAQPWAGLWQPFRLLQPALARR